MLDTATKIGNRSIIAGNMIVHSSVRSTQFTKTRCFIAATKTDSLTCGALVALITNRSRELDRFGVEFRALDHQLTRIAHALDLRINLGCNDRDLRAGANQPSQFSHSGLTAADHQTRLPCSR